MDKIDKTLQKLNSKERAWVKEILECLSSGKLEGLAVKKLKGREDIFRIRKSDIRIIYRVDENDKVFILSIERRSEGTYKI